MGLVDCWEGGRDRVHRVHCSTQAPAQIRQCQLEAKVTSLVEKLLNWEEGESCQSNCERRVQLPSACPIYLRLAFEIAEIMTTTQLQPPTSNFITTSLTSTREIPNTILLKTFVAYGTEARLRFTIPKGCKSVEHGEREQHGVHIDCFGKAQEVKPAVRTRFQGLLKWLFDLMCHREPQTIVKVFVSSSSAPEELHSIIKQEPNTIDRHNEQNNKAKIGLPFFNIHKDFICFYSPFFATAFKGPYDEGQTQCMTLYDTNVEAFGMFNHWLYQQKPPTSTEKSEPVHLLHLSKLWHLGQRVSVPSLQNKVMHKIFFLVNEGKAINSKNSQTSHIKLPVGITNWSRWRCAQWHVEKRASLNCFAKEGFRLLCRWM
jgi:BTB/POZ domain